VKVAFDTNILLDAIANRADYEVAQKLILAVATEKIEGIVTANSITDIYYIARKRIGDVAAREALWGLLEIFDIASVSGDDCALALDTPMIDFEDAVLAVCAKKEGAAYIVTRDEGFILANSPVPARDPEEILTLILDIS
jgi:Predicted nucleic-acid-binding protein, contains PIN domain